MILLTPLTKKKFSFVYDGVNLSNIHYFSVETSLNSKKPILNCELCTGQCYKNNDKHKCKLKDMDSYCYKSVIRSCPYHAVTLTIKEPRKNNYLYPKFDELCIKLDLLHVFGEYTDWVYENRQVNSLTDDEFKMLYNIPEFDLNNVTRTKSSFLKILDNIDKEPTKVWEDECNFNYPFRKACLFISVLIKMYEEKIKSYRDGRLLRPFLNEDEANWERYQEKNTIRLIPINDYYIIKEYWSNRLWKYAQKNNKAPKKVNDQLPKYFYFHRNDIDEVKKYIEELMLDWITYTNEGRLLLEKLSNLENDK